VLQTLSHCCTYPKGGTLAAAFRAGVQKFVKGKDYVDEKQKQLLSENTRACFARQFCLAMSCGGSVKT
jgi:hypothetical protein